MRFDDFVLQLDASSRGGYRARVIKSPFGEGAAAFSLSVLDGVYQAAPSAGISRDFETVERGATAHKPVSLPAAEVGSLLFNAVFQGQIRTLFDKSLGQLERSPELGIRLKIKLDPGDEDVGRLAGLPWELLCDGETADYFALSRQTSLVRYLDVPRPSQPIPFTPPLRILAVGASPHSLPPLDLSEEMRRLAEVQRSSSGVEIDFLEHASAGAVRERLAADAFNILHFMGHGAFDRASGEGMLAFEKPGGALEMVSGRSFASKLRDMRSLGVVVLNACNTALAGNQGSSNAFRGVATALVLGGVPAVAAMQRPIADRAAIGFSTAFYRHLARGDSIDEALTEGRQAIHSAEPMADDWSTPVLFLRISDGAVFVARPAEEAPLTGSGSIAMPAAQQAAPQFSPQVSVPFAQPIAETLAAGPTPARRWGPRIAAGTAGVVLVAIGIQTRGFGLGGDKAATNPDSAKTDVAAPMTTNLVAPDPATDRSKDPVSPRKTTSRGDTTTRSTQPGTPRLPVPDGKTVPNVVTATPPAQPPVAPDPMKTTPPPAAAVEYSKIQAKVLGIARRDGGGLQVTVSFANNADHLVSLPLDLEGSMLSDDQGQRYSILDSDVSGPGGSLDITAGSSSRHTFDFPAPKLGSKTFLLTLLTQSGRRISVSGSPVTLEGSP